MITQVCGSSFLGWWYRTKEQLGYRVDCGVRVTYRVLGFCFRVQSAKYTPPFLEHRINTFIASFSQVLVSIHLPSRILFSVLVFSWCRQLTSESPLNPFYFISPICKIWSSLCALMCCRRRWQMRNLPATRQHLWSRSWKGTILCLMRLTGTGSKFGIKGMKHMSAKSNRSVFCGLGWNFNFLLIWWIVIDD